MSRIAMRLGLLCLAFTTAAFGQTINSVTSAASFTPGSLSPGSIATIFGANLASSTTEAGSIPLPFTLADATVTVNGVTAPLFYASAVQINFQVPYETTPGTASVAVSVAGAGSAAFSVSVDDASPGIFSFGTNRAVAQNPDYSLNDSDSPVAAGSYITAYLTGLGPLDNPVADGAAAPQMPLSRATSSFSATIGGQNANVFFLGLSPGFVALAQADITIPALPSGTYPLVVTIDGIPSNGPLITVSGPASTAPQLTLLSSAAAAVGARNVALNGGAAYLCGTQAIAVVDISDPANPAVIATVGQADLNGSGTYCGLLGNSLIEVVNTQTLVVYDVTDPTSPTLLTSFSAALPFAGDIFFAGTTGFLTTDWFSYDTGSNSIYAQHGELYAYDFSNPAQPVFDSSLQPSSAPASQDASPRFGGVAPDNQNAYIVSTTSTGGDTSGGSAQVQVIDISNPADMQAIGDVIIPEAGVATAIAVQDGTALVSGNTMGWRNPGLPNFDFTGVVTLTALDVSDPTSPTVVSTVGTNIQSSFGALISPLGNGFFAVSILAPADNNDGGPLGSGSLGVVDATDPRNLQLLTMDSLVGLQGIAVSGSYLYAATSAGLSVYQITGPN